MTARGHAIEEVGQKIRRIRSELQGRFLEREREVDGALMALLSGQHLLLIGPPGTAKSMLADELCKRIEDAVYFQWLLTRFTTPEEVFGAVSLKGLEQDEYRRVTAGKLPECDIAFLDEVFKANSSILNALLTLINERKFHNGREVVQVPLLTLFGASNELPEEDELTALYDRFLLRYQVSYLRETFNFLKMLTLPEVPPKRTTLSRRELEVAAAHVRTIPLPDTSLRLLADIRKALQEKGFVASDRRYRQAIGLLRANAFLEGRTHVADEDLLILEHVLWREPTEQEEIRTLLHQTIFKEREKATRLLLQARELRAYLEQPWEDPREEARVALEVITKLRRLVATSHGILQAAPQRDAAKISDIHEEISDILEEVEGRYGRANPKKKAH